MAQNGDQKEQKPKYKFLFVTQEALSSDLAWQLTKEGHSVRFYCHDLPEKDVGDGFVEKVDDWEPHKDWADIIVFDDIGFGAKADQLRKAGKFVVGGSAYTDRLELDRDFGQKELKAAGVGILPGSNFTSFDEAISFVKSNPDKYVIKPSGEIQDEKELLFVGKEENGNDVLQVLEHYKETWSKKMKIFMLQKVAEGVEVAAGAFFNGKDFAMPICVNFEHKKLFPNEIGPSTGEMGTLTYFTKTNPIFENTLLKTKEKLAASGYVGYVDVNCIANAKGIWPLEWTCFDEKTEILTRSGWKTHGEVGAGDEALSINPKTREISWKRITGKMVKDYSGEMVRIGAVGKAHTGVEALVTPDHNVLIDHDGKIMFSKAGSMPIHNTKLIRAGHFKGRNVEYIEVPEYIENHYLGRHGTSMSIIHRAIRVEAKAFATFLGLYLAEGSFWGHIVSVAQSPQSEKRKLIVQELNKLGLKYTEQKSGAFQFSTRQFCSFLDKFNLRGVHAGEKFVPPEIKELSPELLEAFVYGFALGDGSWHRRTGQLTLTTSSKRLADDLQEIIIKCGWVANIKVKKTKGTVGIGGSIRKNDTYYLSIRTKKRDYSLDNRVIGKEAYAGKVWDVEVEDWHTMLVRRNGKPFFSGNCRFGYPTISIQMEGISSEWGQMLYDLAHGNDPQIKFRKGYQVGVVVAIPPFPFEDQKAFKKYSEGAAILFKRQNLDGIHIGEVKREKDEWYIAGQSGYALVVTGSGATVSDAIADAYQNVSNVMIPNMFYRSDIGRRWSRDSDMLLSWGYF